MQPALHEQVRAKVQARLKTYRAEADVHRRQLEADLARVSAEVDRLVTFIRTTDLASTSGSFESLRSALDAATRR